MQCDATRARVRKERTSKDGGDEDWDVRYDNDDDEYATSEWMND